MTNIIVVLPKLEDAKNIKNILVRNGFHVTGIGNSGAQALSQADDLNDGIVICSYRLPDSPILSFGTTCRKLSISC